MINWTLSDAASINEILSTPLGLKWLGYLYAGKPPMTLTTTESAALTGAYRAGYEHVFNVISLSRDTRPQESVSAKTIDMTKD